MGDEGPDESQQGSNAAHPGPEEQAQIAPPDSQPQQAPEAFPFPEAQPKYAANVEQCTPLRQPAPVRPGHAHPILVDDQVTSNHARSLSSPAGLSQIPTQMQPSAPTMFDAVGYPNAPLMSMEPGAGHVQGLGGGVQPLVRGPSYAPAGSLFYGLGPGHGFASAAGPSNVPSYHAQPGLGIQVASTTRRHARPAPAAPAPAAGPTPVSSRFGCSTCPGVVFSQAQAFWNNHQNLHSASPLTTTEAGSYRFECEACHRCFRSKPALHAHSRREDHKHAYQQ